MIQRLTISLVLFAMAIDVAIADEPRVSADGYCLVSTVDSGVWIKGESTIKSDYCGRRFYFLSGDEKMKFDHSPARYAPMLDGNDPVLACDSDRLVAGKRELGMRHDERTFFFSSRENMDKFYANANHYLARSKDRQRIEDKLRDLERKRGQPASGQAEINQTGG